MKKIIYFILSAILLAGTSCNDVLDQKAVDSFNEDIVFSDINLVKAYLGSCYRRMGGSGDDGVLGMHRDMLGSATEHTYAPFRPNSYVFVKGTLSPDNLGFFSANIGGEWLYWNNLYADIQNVNTILARIDNTPVATSLDEALRTQIKGEAYFIRAFEYTHLLLLHGGVVLVDKPFSLNDDFSTFKRSSIAATKDFILSDIASAIEFLPAEIEQGRATRAAAAALKSRLLNFCASELPNGGYEAGNELVSFPAGSRTALLEASRDAAKDVIDGKYGKFALVGNTAEPALPLTEAQILEYADNFFNIFNQHGAWNSETIWAIQYALTDSKINNANRWNGPNGYHNSGNSQPSEQAIRTFEMADGQTFVWDASNPGNDTLRRAKAEELAANPLLNPYNGREPRFYATVLFHGAPWQERPSDAKHLDPYNKIQTGHFYNLDGTIKQFGVDTRNSEIEDWNGTWTGYYLKKFMDPAVEGQYYRNTNHWVEIRYAEVLLNYAEALIELGGAGNIAEGLNVLNLVRHRAGLPSRVSTDQAQARNFVRHERDIEFFGEGQHFWDIRRWKTAAGLLTNNSFYGTKIKEYVNGDMEWLLDYKNLIDNRSWGGDHFYWLPIPRTEINKAPQLQQNPGYN
jgi:hypothetical protein